MPCVLMVDIVSVAPEDAIFLGQETSKRVGLAGAVFATLSGESIALCKRVFVVVVLAV